ERVRCERGSLNLQPRFGGLQRADACAHYAAWLARADRERRDHARGDERVRLHELHDGPSEGEIGELLCAWLTARDDLRRRDVYASVVPLLQQHASLDRLHVELGASRA